MGNFQKAYAIGRVNEGGYVNRADDKGGETYCGVSRKWHPQWAGWGIVDAVKLQRQLKRGDIIPDVRLEQLLETFYRKEFWELICGDQIANDNVATYIYDWSLTSGGARKAIQKEIGVFADGDFGNDTLTAINAGGAAMLAKIRDARVKYYNALIQQDPANRVNASGWMNRALGLYQQLAPAQ
jgi:lysozyme family protein